MFNNKFIIRFITICSIFLINTSGLLYASAPFTDEPQERFPNLGMMIGGQRSDRDVYDFNPDSVRIKYGTYEAMKIEMELVLSHVGKKMTAEELKKSIVGHFSKLNIRKAEFKNFVFNEKEVQRHIADPIITQQIKEELRVLFEEEDLVSLDKKDVKYYDDEIALPEFICLGMNEGMFN